MIANNAALFKWTLYSLAALLCLAAQMIWLQRITLWGVIPFVYPLLASIPATYEGPFRGTAFALAIGFLCDLLLPEHIPCFYTLTFPVTGLIAALLSQELLPAGLLCSYAVTAIAFVLSGLFHCFLMWSGANPAWGAGMFLTLREFLITAPLLVPLVTLLFQAVANRTHEDDPRNG